MVQAQPSRRAGSGGWRCGQKLGKLSNLLMLGIWGLSDRHRLPQPDWHRRAVGATGSRAGRRADRPRDPCLRDPRDP